MLSLVERGMRNPTLETLLKVSEAIGVNLGNVLNSAQRNIGNQSSREA